MLNKFFYNVFNKVRNINGINDEDKNIGICFTENRNIKMNINKLKRRNINRIPVKFSLVSPVNFIKQINTNRELMKQRSLFKTNNFVKGSTEGQNKCFSITIVPHSSSNVKSFKISNLYIKFAFVWVLFLTLSIYSISHFINIWAENRFLKASIDVLYTTNMKQNALLSGKYNEISKLLDESNATAVNVSELSTKYREIVDKYVEGRLNGGIASRSGDRSGSTFLTDVKELRNILTEISQANASKENALIDLSETEKKLRDYLDSLPTQWPINGRISSSFGQRRDPITYRSSFHKGIDIAANYGVDIKASGSGKVTFVGSYNEYGQTVIIDHGNGLTSLYGHASKILVKKGQSINKETTIARVGSSGRSTGAHLHFEIRVNDTPVDPIKYLDNTK